jgi:hypothetical protein
MMVDAGFLFLVAFSPSDAHTHMHVHITRLTGMRIGREAVWKHICTSMRTYA